MARFVLPLGEDVKSRVEIVLVKVTKPQDLADRMLLGPADGGQAGAAVGHACEEEKQR